MNPALGTASVVRGDARSLPLADDTVDLVVTSPPYFALRSYQDGGEHYEGQIGDEPTPAEFVDSLLEVTRECVRVLKPSGSLWVNLGDKYASSGGHRALGQNTQRAGRANLEQISRPETNTTGYPNKTLLGIPWRYANRCVDDLGLILRAEVVWSKPNGLPESVTDRVRRSHEQWFHFTLRPRYFSAVDEIREPHDMPRTVATADKPGAHFDRSAKRGASEAKNLGNPLGKLPGSVWTIPTEPLKVPDQLGVDHFAAFPTEWPKRIIRGWSPAGVCIECGEGRRPVVDKVLKVDHIQKRTRGFTGMDGASPLGSHGAGEGKVNGYHETTITGYACACPDATAPTTPGVVLDPFGGTGTTAMVAKALGRHGITVDRSADYCRLAEWRTNDRDQLAKVLGIAKAAGKPDADQLDLFGGTSHV